MTRWLPHPLALAALLCCLCALPALGQSATDLSDDFDDGVVDSSKWFTYTFPEGTGSIEERDSALVMTRTSGDTSDSQLSSRWALRGAFDVQVDYQLLQWPQSQYLRVLLMANPAGDVAAVGRYQMMDWGEYLANYLSFSQCICGGVSQTADMTGKLRLARDADDNLTASYWSAATDSWIEFSSATVPGDVHISLLFGAVADQPAQVAFDNFRVNSGEVVTTPPPIESDDFDDGVLDSSKWIPASWPDGNGSIEERDGMLVATHETGDYSNNDLWSRWALRGAFDVQVDYQLLQWPESRYLGVLLMANPAGDLSSVCRYQNAGWNAYVASYLNLSQCICAGINGTTDMTGTLRLVRDADNNLTGSYWSAETNSWVAFPSGTVPGDVRIALAFDATADQQASVAFDNFRVNSGEVIDPRPQIQDIRIDRGRSRNLWGEARGYQQRLSATVSATPLMPIACVVISDPSGGQYVMSPCAGGGWADWYSPGAGLVTFWISQDPDYTVHCGFSETNRETPPDPGSYTVRVLYGGELTYVTPPAPAIPEGESAVSLLSPSLDAVIDDPAPLFQWTSPAGVANRVRLRSDGLPVRPPADAEGYLWDASMGVATQAAYTGPALEPGHTYLWQVESSVPLDDGVTDPLVSIWQTDLARGRFTEYLDYPTTLPSLPGRIAWTQVIAGTFSGDFSVLSYSPDPWVRLWLSPEAGESPSFTWDGSTLLYGGGWVDTLDDSPATRIPGMEGSYDTRWSPDATRITFTDSSDMFMLNADGSDLHPLLATEDDERRAEWSPDGRWIAYRKMLTNGSPTSVRLMRPDGSEDHEVVATGVSGYPDYVVLALTDPTWSPDATRLAVSFGAMLPDGAERDGIGIISPEGGLLTPVFLTPPGYVCCASPMLPRWSPDGASIVFSSGHHLAADPGWQNGKFEHGVELWMMSADGTGEPVRLTYNYSFDHGVAWWAPNTPVGKGISIVKGEATLTFAQVTAEGSTRMNVTDDVPGPAPAGYCFASDLWSGATTASYQGDITVALNYDASLVGHEDALALMEWNAEKGKWQNITAHPIDAVNHIIRGQAKSLGLFAVCLKTR